MPNIIAHLAICAQTYEIADPKLLLGSTLPDFVGMYRDFRAGQVRLTDFADDPTLTTGIRFHQQTDTAYDGLDATRNLKRQARADLYAIRPHLGRGAVRACADVGTEMLLNGLLLKDYDVDSVYARMKNAVRRDDLLEKTAVDVGFKTMVADYFTDQVSERYRDSERVAAILWHRFESRRSQRLVFAETSIPAVAEALKRQRLRVQPLTRFLLTQTVDKLKNNQRATVTVA